jgi:hypothetical protein
MTNTKILMKYGKETVGACQSITVEDTKYPVLHVPRIRLDKSKLQNMNINSFVNQTLSFNIHIEENNKLTQIFKGAWLTSYHASFQTDDFFILEDVRFVAEKMYQGRYLNLKSFW